jgi:hypothetical protein
MMPLAKLRKTGVGQPEKKCPGREVSAQTRASGIPGIKMLAAVYDEKITNSARHRPVMPLSLFGATHRARGLSLSSKVQRAPAEADRLEPSP